MAYALHLTLGPGSLHGRGLKDASPCLCSTFLPAVASWRRLLERSHGLTSQRTKLLVRTAGSTWHAARSPPIGTPQCLFGGGLVPCQYGFISIPCSYHVRAAWLHACAHWHYGGPSRPACQQIVVLAGDGRRPLVVTFTCACGAAMHPAAMPAMWAAAFRTWLWCWWC